jgi:hypothetical protein
MRSRGRENRRVSAKMQWRVMSGLRSSDKRVSAAEWSVEAEACYWLVRVAGDLEIERLGDVLVKREQGDMRLLMIYIVKMPCQRKAQCKQRRFASGATRAPAGIQEENQAMRARVGCERKNLNGLSVNFSLEVSNRNILDRKIVIIAQGNRNAASLASGFLRPCRTGAGHHSQQTD